MDLEKAFLRVEGLSFRYGGSAPPVLRDFSLTMGEGEVVGVAGASGCGKTTLLRLIAGLERPLRGIIEIDGLTVAGPGRFVPPENRRVGMLFQDYGLFPHMTVSANIAFGLHRIARSERRRCVAEMLELIRMPELARRYPYELSGGQQQRVALARALAPRPKLLLLDEPFSTLDAGLRASIRGEVRDIISASAATCLLVSHDKADLEAVCGRILSVTAVS
ncbi:MAG: ABC transporter ATP-binding protein [Planctomycetota bacterium]|jgi:iron(III) transport system ATP-binding protein|nr:ABC transporter ATP-binding protein [Planctomycetota bacterium]